MNYRARIEPVKMGIYVDFKMQNCGFISTVECVFFYSGNAFSSETDLIARNVYCLASEATVLCSL
jgi:hypothetical protein